MNGRHALLKNSYKWWNVIFSSQANAHIEPKFPLGNFSELNIEICFKRHIVG